MSVATATPAQLAQLSTYVVQLRAVSSQFMKAMSQMNALQNYYNETVSGIIGTPAGTTIVDNTGLAGAMPLTDTQVVTMTSWFENILSTYYTATYQQQFTSACGPGNVL